MTITFSDNIFSAKVKDELFSKFQPMPEDLDIRIQRTEEMINGKKDAITFHNQNLVRIEQPWLVYKEGEDDNTTFYILNGVTRYLALKELWETNKDFIYADVPYMVLEEGWTVEDVKSLQLSANNFGTETEEIVIAREAVFLYNDQYEIHLDAIKTNKEQDEKGKVLKGQKAINVASVRAIQDVLESALFRGKTKRHFSRYKNVINNGTDKLQEFIENSTITLRNGDELIVAYNKYEKLCNKANEKPKSKDGVLDAIFMDVKSKTDALNQKILEKYSKLSDTDKEYEPLELKPIVIQKGDIDNWFKEQSSKLKVDSATTETTIDTEAGEGDNGVIDVAKVNEDFEQIRNFGLTFDLESDESNRSSLRELTDILSAQLELTSVAMDTMSTKEIEPLFQNIFSATAELISQLPKVNENTAKLSQLSNKVKKCKKQIDTFYASVQVKESNPIGEIDSSEATDDTDELTEEIDGFEVSAK